MGTALVTDENEGILGGFAQEKVRTLYFVVICHGMIRVVRIVSRVGMGV